MSNPGPSAAGIKHADLLALQEALKDSYTLQDQIGAGGMGTVFRAHDVKHHRTVAIKVLRADLARSMGPQRFQREIETAARLMHPHIVSVFNSGTAANMLYYVMPYVAGESLRERLTREGALSVDDALRIATQIANALGYAHAACIVHRDIKPENILLADGHAWLADFGIARAAIDAGNGHHTTTGALVGTPDYVPPEQLRGHDLDGRADIYSLGCVLYEMLCGRAPFASKSLEATFLGHMTQRPARLKHRSRHLRRVVATALAKIPEERFSSADEFASALAGARMKWRFTQKMKRRAVVTTAGIVASAVTIGAIWKTGPSIAGIGATPPAPDTSRYVVLPFSGNLPYKTELESGIHNALAEWQGIEVVHPEALIADLSAASSPRAVERVARRSDIGRIVRASVVPLGDALRISLQLMDGAERKQTLAVSPSITVSRIDSLQIRGLVQSLLLRGVSDACRTHSVGTAFLPSVHACDKAFSAIGDGDLARADTFFGNALKDDPRYARAALWQAQIRTWVVPQPEDVTPQLQVALADTISLSPRERSLLRGFNAMRNGDYDNACQSFSGLLRADTLDYAAWLGVAECHRRDRLVIRDSRSLSGWSFRRSYNHALRAYQRAFELQPSLMAAYRHASFYYLRALFLTSTLQRVTGQSRYGAAFDALASGSADTIALVPYPSAVFEAARNSFFGVTNAADQQRNTLRTLSARWTQKQPTSAAAAEAAAVTAELSGDTRAVSEIVRARRLAQTDSERRRLAATEVWLRLKFGLAGSEDQLRVARVLADSLVSLPVTDLVSAREFAPLAVLLGRPNQAAAFARMTAPEIAADYSVPIGVAEPAAALEAFSALTASTDSIARLEIELDLAIRNGLSGEKHKQTAANLFTRAVMVAFPSYRLAALTTAASSGAFIDAERSLVRKDYRATQEALRRLAVAQRSLRPADLSADGLYVVAWLYNTMGQSEIAASKLDEWLAGVRWFPPRQWNDPINVGSLMRAMLLRAQIANQSGDSAVAERWYRPVRILWSAAEPEVLKLFGVPSQRTQ